jgi:hypothetical protein
MVFLKARLRWQEGLDEFQETLYFWGLGHPGGTMAEVFPVVLQVGDPDGVGK